MWKAKRLEIEVRRLSRTSGRTLQAGLLLTAPFGLGGEQTEWWMPVHERQLPDGAWAEIQPLAEVETAFDALMLSVLTDSSS